MRRHKALQVIRDTTSALRSRQIDSETGTASVEFALLAWLLFAILFLTIEVGLWASYQSILTNSARDSVMLFSYTENASLAMDKAIAGGTKLSPAVAASQVKLYIDGVETPALKADGTSNTCQPGQQVKVAIYYPRTLLTGFGGLLSQSALPPISAEGVAVCQ